MPSIGWRSARSQTKSSLAAMPFSRLPGRRCHWASPRVSTSPNKSATTTSARARLAACASARPESARISIAMPLTAGNELACQGERPTEVDELGLGALMKAPEQLPLEAEFHVADRERTDPDRGLADGYAVRLCRKPLDAGGRNGIRVGGHFQAPR